MAYDNNKIMNKTEQHKKAILEALEKSLGIVTTACKIAGVGRTQYYTWLKEDKQFRQATEDIDNITLDFAESQLHQQIKQGSTAATIFYLKTKGIKRGYIERQDINQKTTFDSNINFNDLLKAVRSGKD